MAGKPSRSSICWPSATSPPEYAPEAVAERCGVPAATIRRIAAEIADVAFNQPLVLDQPWTDVWGKPHEQTIGRPVAFHAMRGISAHSNGFHSCRALHLLQMLLGAVDTPGSWRYKSPFPRPIPPGPPPAGKGAKPNTPLVGNLLSFPQGPDDLLVDDAGNPLRIDKAFSWEAPMALHGMMHTVIGNAGAGDPYPIDTLFMFMANMAWNSAMNPGEVIRILTEKRADRRACHPACHLLGRLLLRDGALCRPDPAGHDLSRTLGLHLGARPADRQRAWRRRLDPPAGDRARPRRAALPGRADRIRRAARPAGLHQGRRPAKFKDYPDYIVNHQRAPGVGPLAGFRGADGTKKGVGEPNPDQLQRYIDNGCFWRDAPAAGAAAGSSTPTRPTSTTQAMGFIPKAEQIVMQLWSEPLQKFRLAAEGHGERQPPDRLRERIRTYCDPLPIWYAPLEQQGADLERFDLSAVTQRPMAMYHSWGSMNAWLRQIHGQQAVHGAQQAEALGLVHDDWVWVESRSGS